METSKLKKFAQFARRSLIEQVGGKLKLVLATDSAARRENPEAVKQLAEQIAMMGEAQVIDKVAYIWFNRFCALRFMDVNRYTRIGVVSAAEGQFQPEILAEAKMGHIDEDMVPEKTRQQIFALLNGTAPSSDPQAEAYRLLVVAACNDWHRAMPYLFERIADFTELLMPDDLLSGNSILAHMRHAICLPTTEGAGGERTGVRDQGLGASENHANPSSLNPNPYSTSLEVEVIGWLYQFYISEKKDQVFEGLKKNQKITPENIPAATQLFTPHWIVRYLVENSLGRLWMLNRPHSKLIERMEYYIRPDTSGAGQTPGVRDQGLGISNNSGGDDGSEELSGSDRLAKGDGCRGNGVSGDQGISQGGALRADQSSTQGGCIDSLKHSGRTLTQLESGVQKFPLDSTGLQSGSGNTDSDRSKAALHIAATSSGYTLTAQGNQQNAGIAESQTNPWPLTPNPSASPEDFLRIKTPEDIKICDPACGSGHMLTYAFDLLFALYEEEGYEPAEIPEKILTHNLFGIEIDERAGELAAFALTMKARSKSKRFFRKPVQPNICVLKNIHFEEIELKAYMDAVGRDLFTINLQETLRQFEEADNFGSLICPAETDVASTLKRLEANNVSGNLFLSHTHQKVLLALKQADYLSQKYQVVVANPPYKKKADLNDNLQSWLEQKFPDGKYDLYQAFILRNIRLARKGGQVAMITMQGWMFAPRYEVIRANILSSCAIATMAQLGERAFDSIGGEVVSTTAFVLINKRDKDHCGLFIKLTDGQNEHEKDLSLLAAVKSRQSGLLFLASESDFRKIPGQPLVFWASEKVRAAFQDETSISESIITREGLATGSNAIFLREWHEVSQAEVGFGITSGIVALKSGKRWFPYVKGGGSRRWYGNQEHFVNWWDDGVELKNFRDVKTGRVRSHNYNGLYSFRSGFTWSGISGNDFAIRHVPVGFMFDAKGPMGFTNEGMLNETIEGFLNSRVSSFFLRMLAPTLDFKLTHVLSLPLKQINDPALSDRVKQNVALTKSDWDAYETSWDFTSPPLLQPDYRQLTLKAIFQKLRSNWQKMTLDLQQLEEENNRIFINAYGLVDELTPEMPLNEITLTCNPHYRYGGNRSEVELEELLLADTMKEFISYGVGCMFGRYALDKPGLILANQGETIADYLKQIPEPIFPADDDNVIPMLDGDWFTDDISERFRKFLRVTFGEEHYEANLKFIEQALGKDIRKYFLKDFYNDHVRRYKKRPIYWLFSSPKGSFNALIYLHRYRPDTVSVILNDYLREFRTKLSANLDNLKRVEASVEAAKGEKTKALKEIETLKKTIDELDTWERDVLYPLATQKIDLDLDDGVKVNYQKFGTALKKIPGLDTSDE